MLMRYCWGQMKKLLDESVKRFKGLKTKVANLPIKKAETNNLISKNEDTFNGVREALKANNKKWFQEQLLFLVKVLMDELEIQILEKQ